MNVYQTKPETNELTQSVLKTEDLSIFKSIPGNRIPNLKHVNRLVDSIKTYGMKCNPIIVNEKMQVIDGQHRLMAAKEVGTFIYYIIVKGYSLNEVHTLNLNQKNWSKKDYMEGYANMGIQSYINLRNFITKNSDFSFYDCIAFCQNTIGDSQKMLARKVKMNKNLNVSEVFEEGTWTGKDFNLAQEWADKIRMIQPYFKKYNHTVFVRVMIAMIQNENFDFDEFMHKLKLQPTALDVCQNSAQYKKIIEEIYNFRSRNKVNLRYK